jgi:NAD(P)-dependent dehydrogenase (short-subunit alcohol dehydrogenase family)
MVRETIASFGRLDAAYNNAGVQNVLAETADTTREDYDRVMGINLSGIWSSMKFELQHMRKQGSGAIVNCINAVALGLIQTPMSDQMIAAGQGEALKAMEKSIPMARVGRPEEIANAVLWLCSDAASYVSGDSISVDGGFVMR